MGKIMNKSNIKGIRLVIGGISIFFVFFVLIRIFFDESKKFSPLSLNNTTMFISIWAIIILFSLTFLFILIRNIIKLYYDKTKDYTGGRFKKRLVFFFISFSIIPTLLLFIFATELINEGIDKWFAPGIESIMNKFEDLEGSYYEKAKDDLEHFSKIIADDIKSKKKYTSDNSIYLHNSVKKQMKEYNLHVVNIYRNQDELISLISPEIRLREYEDLPTEFVYKELGGSDPAHTTYLKEGVLIRSGDHFTTNEGDEIMVIIGMYFPEKYIKNLNALDMMVKNYTLNKRIKDDVKTTYMLLFIFITILIVFSASWLGLYLARGITTPIGLLVTAAAEVANGNLEMKINYKSKDEFNALIREFNRMVSDLKENRAKLNMSTIELGHRRSMTENILKNITTGVIALNSRGEIIDINPAAANMLSLDADNALKKHYSKVASGDSYKNITQIIEKAFSTNFKLIEKEIDVKIGGKILNLATKITQIRNPIDNKFAGILVVLTDLTELIKAQRMLVWREVAKRIAHEIKNPLTPITISSQRILKSFELPDDKFRKIVEDSLNIILQELDSIRKLAEEFGDFARLPAVKFSKGDINQVLEKLISVYSSIYSNIEFNVNLDVAIPILVKMDYDQIKRVFVNIIDNSIEALREEGRIDISTKYNEDSQFIGIEIADNGPGISDEDKQKLFIPYFSNNKSTGTGLGLAIAHNIVEEHNGLISVVDNEPKGTSFIIELPA
jgi:two-component system nitrogen regulation sensor histidine kinase NtrY